MNHSINLNKQRIRNTNIIRTGIVFLFFCFSITFFYVPCSFNALGADFQVQLPKLEAPDSLGWDKDVSAGLNLSQTAYTNWKKGGESSLAWVISNNSLFKYNAEKYLLTIDSKLIYGKTKIGGSEARKSDDRINIEGMIQNKKPVISMFASLRAETQFDLGKRYAEDGSIPVSNFIDPLYLFQVAGIVYNYDDNFQSRLGVALKQTITRQYPFWTDDQNTDKIEKVRSERGLDSRLRFNMKVMQNINYKSEMKIFSTLKSFKKTDVEFENTFTTAVNKYVVVNFHYYVIYDRNMSKSFQIYEGLTVGLTFNLW